MLAAMFSGRHRIERDDQGELCIRAGIADRACVASSRTLVPLALPSLRLPSLERCMPICMHSRPCRLPVDTHACVQRSTSSHMPLPLPAVHLQGRAFIDRDPAMFRYVLDYLREGELPPLPENLATLERVRREFDYFMVDLPLSEETLARKVHAGQFTFKLLEVHRDVRGRSANWFERTEDGKYCAAGFYKVTGWDDTTYNLT